MPKCRSGLFARLCASARLALVCCLLVFLASCGTYSAIRQAQRAAAVEAEPVQRIAIPAELLKACTINYYVIPGGQCLEDDPETWINCIGCEASGAMLKAERLRMRECAAQLDKLVERLRPFLALTKTE